MKLRKPALALVVVFSLVTASAALTQSQDKEPPESSTTSLQLTQCALEVSGMTCGGCAGRVEKGLLKVAGVKQAKVDWKSGDVKVKYDKKKTTPEKIVASFNKANPGFRAQLPKPKAK